MNIFYKIFRQRHYWELDDLSKWMLFFGKITPQELWTIEGYQQCKKCGKRVYFLSLPMKIDRYCELLKLREGK